MFQSKIYRLSPPAAQEVLIAVRALVRKSLREGVTMRRYLQEARERELWTAGQLEAYQRRNLRRVLEHAYSSVPYYIDRLSDTRDFDSPEDALRDLPILSKSDIVSAGIRLLSASHRGPRIKGSTSGTTGTPITIFQDFDAINRENAFVTRQLSWAGYAPGSRRAWIRGDMIVPLKQAQPPYWRLNRAEHMLMMSSYHLSPQTVNAYVDALATFAPRVIQAYPSSIAFLARHLAAHNAYYRSDTLRAIVTSSETFSREDRALVEERFGCRIFDWYGQFERVAAIGTCEHGNYHLIPDYSYVELHPDPGSPGTYELVGTSFNNLLMPLVRYKTGDSVTLSEKSTICACNRQFPLVESVVGRRDDYVCLPDGRVVGRLDHIFKGLSGIAEAQIIQDELSRLRIVVVPSKTFSDATRHALARNALGHLGTDMSISIEMVDSIPRTASGKFRSVISNVSRTDTERVLQPSSKKEAATRAHLEHGDP